MANPIPTPMSARPRRGASGCSITAGATIGAVSGVRLTDAIGADSLSPSSEVRDGGSGSGLGRATCVGSSSDAVNSGVRVAAMGAGGVTRVGSDRELITSGETVPGPREAGAGTDPGSGRRAAGGGGAGATAAAVAALATRGGGAAGAFADAIATAAFRGGGAAGGGVADTRTAGAVTGGDSVTDAAAGVASNDSARGAIAAPTIVARRFLGAAAVVAGAPGLLGGGGTTTLRPGAGVVFTFADVLTSNVA